MSYKYKTRTVFDSKESKNFKDFWVSHKALWKSLKMRLENERDAFVLVTGNTGDGKSHLIGNLCFKLAMGEDNFILKDESKMFVPEEDYIIDPEEFAYKMATSSGRVLWGDEFLKSSNRQNWYDPINKAIVERKNTNRKLMNIYFVIQPLETQFSPKLASHLTLWIWVKKRKVAEVYCRISGRKGGKGLDIDSIIKREEKYRLENPKTNFVPPSIHPEYLGRIAWGKLTKKLEKKYNKLVKMKSATGKLSEEEKVQYGKFKVKSEEELIQDAVSEVAKGGITNKADLWEQLSNLELPTEKKIKLLNFYLGLKGLGTFNKMIVPKKNNLVEIAKQLRKTLGENSISHEN